MLVSAVVLKRFPLCVSMHMKAYLVFELLKYAVKAFFKKKLMISVAVDAKTHEHTAVPLRHCSTLHSHWQRNSPLT